MKTVVLKIKNSNTRIQIDINDNHIVLDCCVVDFWFGVVFWCRNLNMI